MKMREFVTAMLPNIGKKKVLEDFRSLEDDLSNVTLPAFEQAMQVYKSNTFRNPMVKEFNDSCRSRVISYKTNNIVTIYQALKTAQSTIAGLGQIISKKYQNDILNEGVTYLVANQLQYISMVKWSCNYARRWLLYIYTVETKGFENVDYREKKETLMEVEYFTVNRETFINALNIMSKSPEKVKDAMDSVPDAVVDPDKDSIFSAMVGASKIDPLGFNMIPLPLNPVYHVRMAYTQWQVNRHMLLQEEKKQLEFKLLYYKQSLESGTPDEKLNRQIEYTTNRIEKMRYKIHKIEGIENDS